MSGNDINGKRLEVSGHGLLLMAALNILKDTCASPCAPTGSDDNTRSDLLQNGLLITKRNNK